MPTLISHSNPRARKSHRCMMCGGRIQPGEQYSRDTLVYGGRIYSWVECPACQSDHICNEVDAWTGGWRDEGVGIEEADEWAHETVRLAKTEDLREIARRWLTRNGCTCEQCAPEIGADS
jgi:hypothetical protein